MRKFTSLLLLGFALGSFAQTPGGVSGSELWFKTAPLNSDLQGYYRWQDFLWGFHTADAIGQPWRQV